LRQGIRNLERQIERHRRKLAADPQNPAAKHWEHEVRVLEARRDALERRLGHAGS
jgi:hypothetical protein